MAAIVEQQRAEENAARTFWKGLVSHGPLKRFFDWLFAGLAIITVPSLIVCSIILAGELSAPSAFASQTGQACINTATILMNAAIEGAMLGCAMAARRAGEVREKKRLHAMGITFLLLTIATIGFAVFHAEKQADQVLLLVRCGAGLIFCYVSHLSESVQAQPVQVVQAPAPVPSIDSEEIARQLLPLLERAIPDTTSLETQLHQWRAEVEELTHRMAKPAETSAETSNETIDETNITSFEAAKFHLILRENETDFETETGGEPRISRKLKQERSAAKKETTSETRRETNTSRGTARQKALRAIKRNPEINATELARRVGITPQYAGQILKQQRL